MSDTTTAPSAAIATVKTLSHVALVVSDLERSVAFYRDVIGFQVFRDQSNDERAPRVFGTAGGLTLELLRARAPIADIAGGRIHQTGLFGFAFSVENLDAACAALHASGVVKVAQPKSISGARLLYVPDPDGNYFELIEFTNGASNPAEAARRG